jgi:hypothetical protein
MSILVGSLPVSSDKKRLAIASNVEYSRTVSGKKQEHIFHVNMCSAAMRALRSATMTSVGSSAEYDEQMQKQFQWVPSQKKEVRKIRHLIHIGKDQSAQVSMDMLLHDLNVYKMSYGQIEFEKLMASLKGLAAKIGSLLMSCATIALNDHGLT